MLQSVAKMKQFDKTTQIKQELNNETSNNSQSQFPFMSEEIKLESDTKDETNIEGDFPDHTVRVKKEQDYETKDGHNYTEDLSTYVHMNTKMSISDKVEQPGVYGEDEDVLRDGQGISLNKVVYKKEGTSVAVLAADSYKASRTSENYVSTDCIVCNESTVDVETQNDYKVTVKNGIGLADTFLMSKKKSKFCSHDVSCRLLNNLQKVGRRHKLYMCDDCGVQFTCYKDLKKHIRIHTGDKPYKCDVCSVGFSCCSNLIRHKRIHTGKKPYKCDVCGVEYRHSGSLTIHKRVHTGEKPYKCDVCGMTFICWGNLTKHKRTHTGEKPYKCDGCSVGFIKHSILTTQKRIHTGEKPYKCDVCGTEFRQRLAMTLLYI